VEDDIIRIGSENMFNKKYKYTNLMEKYNYQKCVNIVKKKYRNKKGNNRKPVIENIIDLKLKSLDDE
jgi:hypothetical protein